MSAIRTIVACALAATLSGCGLFVPEKNALSPDHIDNPKTRVSSEGRYEDAIVRHLVCEIESGIWEATEPHNPALNVPWLKSDKWGTAVTLTITVEDQSGLNPGVSFINPLASMQSTSIGLGATGSANATRTETIQFTYVNSDLWRRAQVNAKNGTLRCDRYQNGVMVESDLKIGQFIYDKAVIATLGNDASANRGWFPFNTFTENITFVAALGGNITPTWKLTRISANTSGTLLSATRTNTNQLIITIGPLKNKASSGGPAELGTPAQNQHNAQVQAGAISTAISTQPPPTAP